MNSNDFSTLIGKLLSLLKQEGKDGLNEDECLFLLENFQAGITLFELTGMLWEYRFDVFFIKSIDSFGFNSESV